LLFAIITFTYVEDYSPGYSDYWAQCYVHCRLYSVGAIYGFQALLDNTHNYQKPVKENRGKRLEQFLDTSSRGLLVEIAMLRVNISFQFGLNLGGWTNSGLNPLFLFNFLF
jgi:hypothetical protein